MTALTIDIDDQLIDALRKAAAHRRTTVDAIVGSALSYAVERETRPKSFRELAETAPLSLEPGRTWRREEAHDRAVLR